MKKIKYILPFLLLFSVFNAHASTSPTIVLNGKPLTYEQQTPYIWNNRTMVPLNQTAKFLSMTSSWDEKTKTASYRKNNRLSTHKICTNTIQIDGKTMQFDTASQIRDNYAMLPLRMLAEMTDLSVQWDGKTKTVYLFEKTAKILRIFPSPIHFIDHSSVKVNVITNTNCDRIVVTDSFRQTISESSAFKEFGSERTFTIYLNKTKKMDSLVLFLPHKGQECQNDAIVSVPVSMTEEEKPKILSIKADDKIKTGDWLDLKIETNTTVETLHIRNSFSNRQLAINDYEQLKNIRIFYASIYVENGNGDEYIYVTPASFDGTRYSRSEKKIFVINPEEIRIHRIKISGIETEINLQSDQFIDIHSSANVEKIHIYDQSNRLLAVLNESEEKDGELIWNYHLKEVHDQTGLYRYQVVATSPYGSAKQTFEIMVYDTLGSDVSIFEVYAEHDKHYFHEPFTVIVRTNLNTKKISVSNEADQIIAESTTFFEKSSDTLLWKINLQENNEKHPVSAYRFTAYNRTQDIFDEERLKIKFTKK